MSMQPRSSNTRAAAKRRAERRRRNRELIRRIMAIFFIGLFVLGTATTAFVAQVGTQAPVAGTTPGSTPLALVPETPAPANQLVEKGDQSAAGNDWTTAISFYRAALGLTPNNGEISFKLGKALLSTQSYSEAVTYLQQAITLNPGASYAGEAQGLIAQYKDLVTPGATASTSITDTLSAPAVTTTQPLTTSPPITR
jgi:tetratricopeptide (TPR) repeat protein